MGRSMLVCVGVRLDMNTCGIDVRGCGSMFGYMWVDVDECGSI